jgi:hypothetical protein
VRRAILCVTGALAFLSGCGNQGDKAASIPVAPKWKGAPYRVTFDAKAAKPNPAGVTLPVLDFTANPDALETRATLVVRFDSSGAASSQTGPDQMVMAPVDIRGTDGSLPADYIDATDKELARLLAASCKKGKVKITLALAKSSVTPHAGDAELDSKRLSDWMPLEVDFKNPHPKC